MKKAAVITGVFLLVAFCLTAIAIQNGYDLFQKALAKERAEGNLGEAIALYKKVIAEAKDEALAAKAQLRIGFCYEKLGLHEAQKAFQKVVDNYPNQVEVVKVAREKLSGLLRIQSLAVKEARGMSIHQLLDPLRGGEEVGFGRVVSPDERYLAYFDYNVGAVALYELATGKKKILKSKLEENEPWGETWSFIWSPDSKSLLCSWWMGPDFHWSDLRIIQVDGTEQRSIFHSGEYDDVYPMDWSTDGNQVLTAFYGKDFEGKKMGLISVEDGSERILKTVDPEWGYMEFSPDDRYIVYDFCPDKEYSRRDISILPIDGKVSNPLVTHPAHDSLVGFSPLGKYVLFTSDRTGTNDLWIIPVKDGRPNGKAEPIKKGLGRINTAGLTQDGSLYYLSGWQEEDIYIAELDQGAGRVNKDPEKMIFSQEGSNSWPQYSSDGKFIVCVQGGGIMAERAETSLCIRSLETGKERQFPLKLQARHPRWTPDDRFIYFTANDRPRHLGIYRIELKTGQVSRAWPEDTEDKPIGDIFVGISPSGQNYYYVHSEEESGFCKLISREGETGVEKELLHRDKPLYLVAALSPDGKWLAVVSREEERVIQVLPSEGGDPRELCRFNLKGGHPTWLEWTPDSKFIVFSRRIDESESGVSGWGLYRVSADGGNPQFMGMRTTFISDIDIHPSGKHLAFCSYGPEWKRSELWVMENFLPETEKK